MTTQFLPKTFTVLRDYDRKQLVADLQAGVVVGIVAIPLALAFAIGSGVAPEKGFITAVIAGFLISFLGGSRVQIGGPTGAFVVIVSGIVSRYGVEGLTICTLIAGILLIVLGLARFGGAIKFIPYPVVTGFTSGIAVIIFSAQVNDLLGLGITQVPAAFAAKWVTYAQHLRATSLETVLVAVLAFVVLLGWPRVSRRVPGPLVAIVVTTVVVAVLDLPVATIGSRFGDFRPAIPPPHLPAVTLERLRELFPSAVTVALLAGVESLLSAIVADGMIGSRHKSNVELVGQGFANIASALFGGIPATGAIARTATNVKNGGRTPVAGMVHAVTVFVLLVAFGRWARFIPLATLAAVLVVVSYHMSEWRAFLSMLKAPRSDVVVLVVTFLLTVFVDLTVAVQTGVVLAAFLFMKRMADVTDVEVVRSEMSDAPDGTMDSDEGGVARRRIPRGVQVFEINGPFFFGAASKIRDVMGVIESKPRVFILRMRNVPVLDASGIRVLDEIHDSFTKGGVKVIIAGLRPGPRAVLERAGRIARFGPDAFAEDIDEALARAGVAAGESEG